MTQSRHVQGKKSGIHKYIGAKRLILLTILTISFLIAWRYYQEGTLSPEFIIQYNSAHPLISILIFILVYAASIIISFPSLPLNLAAGFFWGATLGGIYSTIAVTFGGWISFAIARYFFGQPLAKNFDNKIVTTVQKEFHEKGWVFVAIARINPIVPTGPLNYLLGLTSLPNFTFLWVTFSFLLIPSLAISYIGHTLQTFTIHDNTISHYFHGSMIIIASLTTIVFIRLISTIYKKAQTHEDNSTCNDNERNRRHEKNHAEDRPIMDRSDIDHRRRINRWNRRMGDNQRI